MLHLHLYSITIIFLLIRACNITFLQEINFQGEGSILHYGQQLQHCTLGPLWSELKLSCEFLKARYEVDQFNIQNRWRKRGVAMVPTKFGISFTLKLMNQVIFTKCYLVSDLIDFSLFYLLEN